MKKINIILLFLLAFLMPGCSQEPKSSPDGGTENGSQGEQGAETAADGDKLAKYDFSGQEIRILTSINESENWLTP